MWGVALGLQIGAALDDILNAVQLLAIFLLVRKLACVFCGLRAGLDGLLDAGEDADSIVMKESRIARS